MDNTGTSVEVEVGGQNSTMTFSQVNDSGNYTCAVTCRAEGSVEVDIPLQYKATKEVLIYGRLSRRNRPCLTARVLDCKEVHWNVHSCKSLYSLCCVPFFTLLCSTFPADIDECLMMTDNCQQNCTNTEGSFMCSCFSGFILLSDNRSCAG